MRDNQILASEEDYKTLYTFRAICEQVLDCKGIDGGKEFLYRNFPDNIEWVDDVITDYTKGERMTEKLEVPDEGILRMIEND